MNGVRCSNDEINGQLPFDSGDIDDSKSHFPSLGIRASFAPPPACAIFIARVGDNV
jgi:hypothetical protein